MKRLILLILTIFTFSCKDNMQIDKLKNQNDALKDKINQLETEKIKPKIKSYTDDEATVIIKDYYSFYKSDFMFRNIRLRRRGANIFDVSIEEAFKHNSAYIDHVWNTEMYSLKIEQNGEYNFSRKL